MSNFWQDRSVFVTGASGLIGGHVIDQLLEKDANIVCLVRDWVPDAELIRSEAIDKVSTVRGELEDQVLVERVLGEYEVKTVLHLAAQAIVGVANRNPVSTFESNVRGSWNVLEACRRSPLVSEVVVASSDKAYGDQPKLPYTEDMPLLAGNPYDVSKACTDLIAQSYAKTFDLPVVISRCGNFFGEGDMNWNRIVPGTIRSIIRGETPTIRSDGSFVRDYLYAGDGGAAYLLLAEKLAENPDLKGEVFNFSTDIPMTVLEITQAVLDAMGSDAKAEVLNEASNEILKQHLSSKKAREVLGWKPQYTVEEALKKTIDWYKELLK